MINRRLITLGKYVAAAAVTLMLVVGLGSWYYRLPPLRFVSEAIRRVGTPVLGAVYGADLDQVRQITTSYWHGLPENAESTMLPTPVSFVYESPDVPYLRKFRDTYKLDELVSGAPGEYEAILRLGGWVGSQFDHGLDDAAGGHTACDPTKLVEAGRQGKKYWCEIAARIMVYAAASVGLPARIITSSRDGYTWEHAVAEIWSNDFGKWFVIDTDFNMVYEHDGVPLSAAELLEQGQSLKDAGQLTIRRIAPPKPAIAPGDAIYVYQYVHLDMRTDWCSRTLRRGSPAGGDLSTEWFAREPLARRILTAKKKVAPQSLNWPLNGLWAVPVSGKDGAAPTNLAVVAFSPYFEGFERDTGAGWEPAPLPLLLTRGAQQRVRVVTSHGWRGPVFQFTGEKLIRAVQ